MTSWSSFLVKVFDDFKIKEHNFNHLAEMNIITIANKLDMSYGFYNRHDMQAVKWKLNALINRNKSLINKINRNWTHTRIEKFKVIVFDHLFKYEN